MSSKLKALGLGLIAALAVSAFFVANASATVSGHFTSDEQHTIVKGAESGSHKLEFRRTSPTGTFSGEAIVCDEATYQGTVQDEDKTVTSVQVTPTYNQCHTAGSAAGTTQVTTNGCSYTLLSNATTHGTVVIDCPEGKAIVIDHPQCTLTVPAQTPAGGATYTVVEEQGRHAMTANVTLNHIQSQFHGGLCVLLGTSQIFDLNGSVTIWGENTAGGRISIPAAPDHFTSDEQHTIVKGLESGAHKLKFNRTSLSTTLIGGPIICDGATYLGTTQDLDRTVTNVQVTPAYSECHTEGEAAGSVQVTVNGCSYTLGSPVTTAHGAVTIDCPEGKAIIVHHPQCTITVPAQTPVGGVTYAVTEEQGKHALTANVTLSHIQAQFHGLCGILGTSQRFSMSGSATVWGENTAGGRINVPENPAEAPEAHFASEAGHTIVKGFESGTHRLKLSRTAPTGTFSGGSIVCDEATYQGTVQDEDKTITNVQITPTYAKCHTENEAAGTVQITMNGCSYTLSSVATAQSAVTIDCPEGKAIVIHHPQCTITIPAQTPNGGFAYTTTVEQGKHTLTADAAVNHIQAQFHSGLCTISGTSQIFDLTGSITAWGENTLGERVGITST